MQKKKFLLQFQDHHPRSFHVGHRHAALLHRLLALHLRRRIELDQLAAIEPHGFEAGDFFFRQSVGVLDKDSDVTVTFDVSEPWQPDVLLNAALLDANLMELAAELRKDGKSLLDSSDDEIERTFRINTLALFSTTRAFLPGMLARGAGHVVNIA